MKYIPIDLSLTLLFNQIYGEKEYSNFKENGTLSDFKKEYIKLLKTIKKSIKDNIIICDDTFLETLLLNIEEAEKDISICKKIEDINSSMICFFTRFIFSLLGMEPQNWNSKRTFSTKSNRKLNKFRSIQYTQTQKQKQALNNEIKRNKK